jgi:hypothetical protein
MDYEEKSFAAAGETSKLLITLSTALVAFCAAVVNVKVAEPTLFSPASTCQKLTLVVSWAMLLISTALGIWAQLAITHVLSKATAAAPPSVWSGKITLPVQTQILTFLLGLILLAVYGCIRLFG